MKLTSFGAALEVTGSQHLLEVNGKRILLDCGLFQGHRKLAFEKNRDFKYDPASIDAVLISHAHIDHTGNLPHLVKEGFKGFIHCTPATTSLCEVMLADSAYIQEADAGYFARKHKDTALAMDPLYTQEDAAYCMQFFKEQPLDKPFELFPGVTVTFLEAGHVLGSGLICLDIEDQEDGKKKRLVYTGDLGRTKLPILNDPHQVQKADYLLCESTYGNRNHAPIEEGIPDLARVINRTIQRGGKVLIPAFALERTQELIYSLHLLAEKGEIPKTLPIFIDSPLATRITGIFGKHTNLYDAEIQKNFKSKRNPFDLKQLKFTATVEESKKLNYFRGPCIIISASGMCEAGRIRHHLRNNIEDPRNSLVVVGYMAENTLGRKIVDGENPIKIFDEMYEVKAEVVILESFSAHADKDDMDRFIGAIHGLKKVMLVHGEVDQSQVMAERIRKNLGVSAVVMEPGMPVSLNDSDVVKDKAWVAEGLKEKDEDKKEEPKKQMKVGYF